jgi:hypothetical protein
VGAPLEQVDAQLVRRLVRLELADIAIPPPWPTPPGAVQPPVYVRIVPLGKLLSVELWDHGLLHGERRVSPWGGGSLTARSIALVSAELAKSLAELRKREARAAARREERARRRSLERRGQPLFARFALSAAASAASVNAMQSWLLGPALDAQMRFDNGARVALGARSLVGSLPKLNIELQWLELGLAPGYTWSLSKRASLGASLFASAATLNFANVNQVDGSASSSTWNARVGARADYALRFGNDLEGHLGLIGGSTVRKIPLNAERADDHFGGLWLGLELGVSLDPVLPH